MKKNKGLAVLITIIILAVGVSAFRVHKAWAAEGMEGGSPAPAGTSVLKDIPGFDFSFKNKKKPGTNHPYIACLHITGTIQPAGETYNQDWLLDTIDDLENDKNNLAIALYVDSPGGTVYESDEAYLRLLKYGESKPVYAYFASLAASGGYYIACSSKYIMANRNCWTGSIGVIGGQFVDLTALMDKYGIKSKTIHSGRNKTMGSYSEPFTKEQEEIMQAMCDECYEQFTDIVAKSRKLPIGTVRKLADGRVYTARQAKENKLIDEIGSWNDLLDVIAAKEFEDVYYEVVDYTYEQEKSFYKYLTGLADKLGKSRAEGTAALPSAVQKIIEPEISYPAYLYRP
ncbi:MAG: signal peptide peptidase SppA [Treponema sp.]|nr:signal peptide peptidase SppA [Treponema sp.]